MRLSTVINIGVTFLIDVVAMCMQKEVLTWRFNDMHGVWTIGTTGIGKLILIPQGFICCKYKTQLHKDQINYFFLSFF
jgi:hypothetical protein